ncbi:carboxypeptidase-like regulatory domain-containing protein [Tunicatimonas pelagia]|uniref:carboxypeptidase-like regulatory domain-containing protein n=1 Tax=Tunicatimonas pelagia TaxID=931531 RepID=UPI002666B27F|nr:carboxypeptidase-like regulatory domain-containing protein [Tunicatimonas pelagia]WKN42675.1 carboxypeptidase-like regulatory domain-containing protein [Tunicatimonas pelagia]
MIRPLIFLVFACSGILSAVAQNPTDPANKHLITISGVVFSMDSITALPYVTVYDNQLSEGTISDSVGYFSLNVYPEDTIVFSSVGYKTAEFVVPDYLAGDQYSIVQGLVRDTVILEEVLVYSLPTTSKFMESFSDRQLDFEKRTESMQTELKSILEEDIILGKYQPQSPNDGITRMYNAEWGLVPPNNFLNPMRWSQFVKDLRRHNTRDQKKR